MVHLVDNAMFGAPTVAATTMVALHLVLHCMVNLVDNAMFGAHTIAFLIAHCNKWKLYMVHLVDNAMFGAPTVAIPTAMVALHFASHCMVNLVDNAMFGAPTVAATIAHCNKWKLYMMHCRFEIGGQCHVWCTHTVVPSLHLNISSGLRDWTPMPCLEHPP